MSIAYLQKQDETKSVSDDSEYDTPPGTQGHLTKYWAEQGQ